MNKQKKAFTLVELIVVITILAILWTIAFISLQWYSKDTRNSVRLSDLLNIDKTLWIKLVTAWKVPVPDNKIDITASGTIFIYQWNAWERVLDSLWVSNWWKDPKDETYYTYATNTSLNKYQLIWFMEWDAIAFTSPHPSPLRGEGVVSIIWNTYAVTDLTDRSIITKWDELWILLDIITNVPLVNWIDVANTATSYKAVFEEDILIEGTGWVLFSNYYNRDKVLLADKELAKLDDSLVWYWDMETLTWWLLKDFSQYWNNWECYDGSTLVSCWTISNWPQFVSWQMWQAMLFDWTNDFIKLLWLSNNLNTEKWTLNILVQNEYFSIWDDVFFTSKIDTSNNIAIFSRSDNTIHIKYKGGGIVNQSINQNNFSEYKVYTLTWNKSKDEVKTYIDWNLISESNWMWNFVWSIWEYSTFWADRYLSGWSDIVGSFFNWSIDNSRIYDRDLSNNEVKTLYEATK